MDGLNLILIKMKNMIKKKIYADETFSIQHDHIGRLGLCNNGPHTNTLQCYITLKDNLHYFDEKYVLFGQVIDGLKQVLLPLSSTTTLYNQRPVKPIDIKLTLIDQVQNKQVQQEQGEEGEERGKGEEEQKEKEEEEDLPQDNLININYMTCLVLGLENSGKSTLIKNFYEDNKLQYYTIPTMGYENEVIEFNDFDITINSIGGNESLQEIWYHYYKDCYALIWVIDASDMDHFNKSKDILLKILSHPDMINKPLLIYANKQDIYPSITAKEMTYKLKNHINCQFFKIFNSIALPIKYNSNGIESDPSIYQGMNWLCQIFIK